MKNMKFEPINSSSLSKAMGVSPEREKILDEAVDKAVRVNKGRHSNQLSLLSEVAENPAELSYVSFHYGTYVGMFRSMKEGIGSFLGM